MDILQSLLLESGIIYCIRDSENNITYQNRNSKKKCSHLGHLLCQNRCLPHIKASSKINEVEFGPHYLKHKFIEGIEYDIILFKSFTKTLILLFPLKDQLINLKNKWSKKGITPREIEILTLKFYNKKNLDIAKTLFISKSTVKTHINNIFKKIGNQSGWFKE